MPPSGPALFGSCSQHADSQNAFSSPPGKIEEDWELPVSLGVMVKCRPQGKLAVGWVLVLWAFPPAQLHNKTYSRTGTSAAALPQGLPVGPQLLRLRGRVPGSSHLPFPRGVSPVKPQPLGVNPLPGDRSGTGAGRRGGEGPSFRASAPHLYPRDPRLTAAQAGSSATIPEHQAARGPAARPGRSKGREAFPLPAGAAGPSRRPLPASFPPPPARGPDKRGPVPGVVRSEGAVSRGQGGSRKRAGEGARAGVRGRAARHSAVPRWMGQGPGSGGWTAVASQGSWGFLTLSAQKDSLQPQKMELSGPLRAKVWPPSHWRLSLARRPPGPSAFR
ncbi:uncharacterized protein LOC144579628 [Callithrix jacchus]